MGFESISPIGTSEYLPSRRALFGWAAGGVALAATASPASALWQSVAPFAGVRGFIGDYVSSRRVPGAIAAVGLGNMPLQAIAAGTLANDSSTAVDLDSLWRIYSMTKPITGIATMMLIDDGKLTLDTPLADILPAFRTMRVLTSADAPVDQTVPADRPITIRQLITHTAGLGYSIVQSGPIKTAYEELGIVPGQVSRMQIPGLSRGMPAPSLTEFADRLATLPLVYQPGTRWSYSIGLDLMGRVIEVVSGQSFDAFLKARIFDPLGMTSTSFRVAAENVSRLATNYAPVGGTLFPLDPAATSIYLNQPNFPYGGAGLVSSARDYDRFLEMLLNEGELGGTRILSAATARLAMSNLIDDSVERAGTFIEGQGFGAGGRVSLAGNATGEGIYGWGGAAGTIAFVDRTRRVRFGGYANYMPSEAYDFQRRLPEVFYADLAAMASRG